MPRQHPRRETRASIDDWWLILFYRQEASSLETAHLNSFWGVICTGTPRGVGMFWNPPIFLKPGDVAEIEIEKLGRLRNSIGEQPFQ